MCKWFQERLIYRLQEEQGLTHLHWSNSETTEDIVGLSVGNYTCSIIDDAGCVLNYSGDINDTFGGMTTDTVIVDETCNQSNGAINVTVNGGIAPYTFSWTGATPDPCCSYTLDMEDIFGDGWDGAFVTVLSTEAL